MSLDITLYVDTPVVRPASSGIFVRRGGETVEVSEEEWYAMNLDHEVYRVPIRLKQDESETFVVWERNITHNLVDVAKAVGIYMDVWRPGEAGHHTAADVLPGLERGLALLKENPGAYRHLEPSNGWGTVDGFIGALESYVAACKQWQHATISARG